MDYARLPKVRNSTTAFPASLMVSAEELRLENGKSLKSMVTRSAQDLSLEPGFDLHWQMTNCERFALSGLLKRLQPKLSLEIGTYMGGSLQVLARFSQAVISVDIDPGVAIPAGYCRI